MWSQKRRYCGSKRLLFRVTTATLSSFKQRKAILPVLTTLDTSFYTQPLIH